MYADCMHTRNCGRGSVPFAASTSPKHLGQVLLRPCLSQDQSLMADPRRLSQASGEISHQSCSPRACYPETQGQEGAIAREGDPA